MLPDAGVVDEAFHQRHPAKGTHRLVRVFNGQAYHHGDFCIIVNPPALTCNTPLGASSIARSGLNRWVNWFDGVFLIVGHLWIVGAFLQAAPETEKTAFSPAFLLVRWCTSHALVSF